MKLRVVGFYSTTPPAVGITLEGDYLRPSQAIDKDLTNLF